MGIRTDRFTVVSAVHLFLEQAGHVLLARRYNTGYEDGKYSVPAGHLDGGEPVSVAMARETWEETGIVVRPDRLRVVHVMHRRTGTGERVDFFLVTDAWDGTPRIMEPDKCDRLEWFPVDDLPRNVIPYVRAAFDGYRRGERYSEFGWDVLVGSAF
jgi:8-oxo-dGTP pyrophosphatase MutT (NUDIX family)